MKFNITKCNVMHLGSRNSGHRYSIYGNELDELKSERDLGMFVLHDLIVFEQCQQAYSKAQPA